MPDKADNGGQPTLEKLQAEGVSIRKCIASEGQPGYGGGNSSGAKTAKQVPALSSFGPVRRGGRGY
jgi:hypothetical protein